MEFLHGGLDEMSEDYLDDYADDPVHDDDDYSPGLAAYSFSEIVEHCIEPTVAQAAAEIVTKLILPCIVFRIGTQSVRAPSWFKHASSAVTGLFVLHQFFDWLLVYPVVMTITALVALEASHRAFGSHRGCAVAVVCLAYNLAFEFFTADPSDWHRIRGVQMILSMKVCSLAFDLDAAPKQEQGDVAPPAEETQGRRPTLKKAKATVTKEKIPEIKTLEKPDFLQFLGYTLCPGNTVFGPWIKYEDYLKIFKEPCWNTTWLIKIILSLSYAFMFLTISTCWNPWLIPDGIWKWWIAYRDAMSFRASHYFVSFVSVSSAVSCGFGGDAHWDVQVAEPHSIEVPRSLTEVVKSWNMPMHVWLKTYCFKPSQKYGTVFAVFATYVVSTLLHGLNFQLGAVLFSLGMYTYTEHKLRRRLAEILDASVTATRPREDSFKHKEGHGLTIAINFLFGLLACFNLAYLGVMFGQDQSMVTGYSWQHTFAKWEELNFASLKLMLCMLVLTRLI